MSLEPARCIVVTGASRGIGAALTLALAKPGRTLLLVASAVENLANSTSDAEGRGATVHTFGVDLGDATAVADLASALASRFPVDMIVNNAGISGNEVLPWETDIDSWWRTQEVNLRAPFILQRLLVPAMLDRGGGRIVDLSSGAAVTDRSDSSDYWVSKTALMRLGGSLHLAGHAQGLRVFEVGPGVVETDMTAAMRMHDGRTEWTDVSEVSNIIAAIAAGELDGLAGAFLRSGQDSLDDLRERSSQGISGNSRRLRITDWD